MIPTFLPFDEPNLFNDYIFMNPEYNDRLCFLDQVDSNTDVLDNMILQQVVMQPIKETKECRPTQIEIEDNKQHTKQNHVSKTRNSGVKVHKHVEDLQNQIEMEQTYYNKI